MDQDKSNSTRMLTHHAQVLPKLHMYDINVKLTQSAFKAHTNTSILRKTATLTLTLSMHTNNTSGKMTMKNNSFMISPRT